MAYSEVEKAEALDLWFALEGTVPLEGFVAELGYPSRTCLRGWIRADPRHDPDKPTYKSKTVLTKLEAIRRVAEGEPAARVGREIGATNVAAWVSRFAEGGTAALLPHPRKRKGDAMAGRKKGEGRRPAPVMQGPPAVPAELPDDPAALKAIIFELQMDNALLREVLDVLKADPGCNPADLTSAERAAAVAALEDRFPPPALRERMGIPKSTYYYQLNVLTSPDGPDWLGDAVEEEFEAEHRSRGYRTVNARLRLRAEPVVVSEKRVRRKMGERGLRVCYAKKAGRFSSYAGEIGDRPPNLPLREDGTHDFGAGAPNEKWVTDITEFKLPADPRKAYLSPVVDLFDGKPVAWSISPRPSAALANSSLEGACSQLGEGEHPSCHTDGGCHYRWDGWVRICEEHGIARSMSRKGRSPDNAACEGFFGNLKNEMFYGRDWRGVSYEMFASMLDGWMRLYSTHRLKAFREDGRTVYDTIDGRRRRLGLAV